MTILNLEDEVKTLLNLHGIPATYSNILLVTSRIKRKGPFSKASIEECITEVFAGNFQARRNGSKSVTYFNTNPLGSFSIYEKDIQTKELLSMAIQGSLLFPHLNPRQMRNAVMALKPKFVKKDTVLIREDDIGHEMYVVESGKFEILKNGEILLVKPVGTLFGEIALLQNVRRTATVRCVEDGKVWVLNMEEFTAIKSTDELNRFRVLKDTLRNKEMFDDEYCKNLKQTKVFLNKGEIIDEGKNLVVVWPGKVMVDNIRRDVDEGDVLTKGTVIDEIEGYYLSK